MPMGHCTAQPDAWPDRIVASYAAHDNGPHLHLDEFREGKCDAGTEPIDFTTTNADGKTTPHMGGYYCTSAGNWQQF